MYSETATLSPGDGMIATRGRITKQVDAVVSQQENYTCTLINYTLTLSGKIKL